MAGVCTGLALLLVSLVTLAHEVLLMRIIAIVHWHHFASVIIGIALLGFGVSGTVLALLDAVVRRHPGPSRRVALGALALSLPASLVLSTAVPLNVLALGWEPEQVWYLGVYALVLAVPFLFAGAYVALVLRQAGARVGLFYGLNLLGSGAGALAVVVLAGPLGPEQLVWLLTGLAAVALTFDLVSDHFEAAAIMAGIAVVIMTTGSAPNWLHIRPGPLKPLTGMLQVKRSRVLAARFGVQGQVHVVDNPWARPDFPGLSMQYALADGAEDPEHRYIVVDGASVRAVLRVTDPKQAVFLDYLQSRLAYDLRPAPRVLVLGAGSDVPVLQAQRCGATHTDVVEPHRQIADLLAGELADFNNRLYTGQDVSLWAEDPRHFIDRTSQRFDLVFVTLGESIGAAGTTASLEERYLLTVESYEHAIDHLAPDGWLVITCGCTPPPRDLLRLVNTVIAAADRSGLDPRRSLAIIRDTDVATVLLKRGPIGKPDTAALERSIDRMGFDPVWYPGIDTARLNRNNIMTLYPVQPGESADASRVRNAAYYQGVTRLLSPGRAAFVDAYVFRLAPCTDHAPFFYHFFRWSSVGDLQRMQGAQWMRYVEKGYWFQWHALWVAGAAAVVLILLPLPVVPSLRRQVRGKVALAAYFALLGLAYIMLEVVMISRAVLLLGYPTAAVGVVVATFLVSSGLGSLVAGSARVNPRVCILVASPSVVVLGIVAFVVLGALTAWLASAGDVVRTLATVIAIAPVGFAMGMLMPSGLRIAGAGQAQVVPWAWGINGFASVCGALSATLVSADHGFTATLAAALVAYAIAGPVGLLLRGAGGQTLDGDPDAA